jgi:hypothetical protein
MVSRVFAPLREGDLLLWQDGVGARLNRLACLRVQSWLITAFLSVANHCFLIVVSDKKVQIA